MCDKPARQLRLSVADMKTKAIYLTTTMLLTATPFAFSDSASPSSADGVEMHYRTPNSNAKLSIIQDITAGERDTKAGRKFSLTLDLKESSGEIEVTIEAAKANYTAHAMTQRLPTTTLVGKSVMLSAVGNGRNLQRSKPDQDLEIGVGQMIGADFPVGLALVDILPTLPATAVSIGSTWSTTRNTRSLEGWAWAGGNLSSEHSVTNIEQLNGHTIVSVETTAKAQLAEVEKGLKYSGEGALERNSSWRFDATDGYLLSLSMRQSTSGINTLPQGEVSIRQFTKVKYTSSE